MSRFMSNCKGRPGMTLVELLVVIGILLLLLATVVPILSPTPDQKGREAAATVLSMINRAKLRAEANGDTGAGIWLEPLTTTGSVAGSLNNGYWWQLDGQVARMASLDMFACEPQNPYNGDDPDQARVLIYPINELLPAPPFVNGIAVTDSLALFESTPCQFIRELCSSSTRILVQGGESYYFRLLSPAEQSALTRLHFPRPYRECNDPGLALGDPHYIASGSANYYTGSGASISPAPPGGVPQLVAAWVRTLPNAPVITDVERTRLVWWQYDPVGAVFPVRNENKAFAIQRPNVRSPTPPLSVPEGYAIDVSWSSHGVQLFHNAAEVRAGQGGMTLIQNFFANQPVQLMFDQAGSLTKVLYKGFLAGFGGGQGALVEQSIDVPADVFLLVGRADRAGLPFVANPTEENPGANWQYPDSRWVKISHSTGKTLIADPVLGVTNVYDSQGYARRDLAAVRN